MNYCKSLEEHIELLQSNLTQEKIRNVHLTNKVNFLEHNHHKYTGSVTINNIILSSGYTRKVSETASILMDFVGQHSYKDVEAIFIMRKSSNHRGVVIADAHNISFAYFANHIKTKEMRYTYPVNTQLWSKYIFEFMANYD